MRSHWVLWWRWGIVLCNIDTFYISFSSLLPWEIHVQSSNLWNLVKSSMKVSFSEKVRLFVNMQHWELVERDFESIMRIGSKFGEHKRVPSYLQPHLPFPVSNMW